MFSPVLLTAAGEGAITKYYSMLTDLLVTPQGVALLLAGLASIIIMANYPKWRWYFLGLLLFVTAINRASYDEFLLQMTYGLNYADFYSPLLPPFRVISENSRPLSGILLVLMSAATIAAIHNQASPVRNTWNNILVLHWVAIVAHMLINGLYLRGGSYALSYALIYLVVVYGASRWMTLEQMPAILLQTYLLPALMMIGGTFYHMVYRSSAVIAGSNRLQGMTDNPNFIAVISAIFAFVFLARCFLQPATLRLRILCGGIAGVFTLFVAWSGSRTGFATFVLMVLLFFRRRLSQLILVVLLITIVLTIGITAFSNDSSISDSRIFSTSDTRTRVWAYQWQNFVENPIFGRELKDGEWSLGESSYFGALSNMGIVGAAPLFIWVFYSIYACRRLAVVARRAPQLAPLCDLVIAAVGGIMLGALFEGILFGTLNFQVFTLVLFMGVGSKILNAAENELGLLRPA